MSIWKTKPLSVLLNEASDERAKELYLQDPGCSASLPG
jgi:hypothetical protein